MKKFTTLTSIFLLTTVLSACAQSYSHHFNTGCSWLGGKEVKASKNYVTKQIKVNDFDQIAVGGSLDVTYTQQAGKPKVEIYTSDNIVDLLDIYVKDGKLNLGFKKNVKVAYNKLEIRVTSEDLNAVSVAGSGDFDFTNGLKTDQLKMNVAGSGDLYADGFKVQHVTASVAGSGDIKCHAVEYLKARVSGSGSIGYKGDPELDYPEKKKLYKL